MKELRKEIEKLVENEDFISYEEFVYEAKHNKEEITNYLEWRVNSGKQKTNGYTEALPEGYAEACKKILERI